MNIKVLKANNGDAFLLSFIDNDNIPRNILIDSGTGSTYYENKTRKKGELYFLIEKIKELKQNIDLLIITHIDDDHIGGVLKWFFKDEYAHELIKEVWYNSGQAIADNFGRDENAELDLLIDSNEDFSTSVNQGKKFEEYIINNNIVWDKKLILKNTELKKFDVKFQFLSPDISNLEKLLKEYQKPKYDYFTSGNENDWKTTISEFIKEETNSEKRHQEDNSLPNGSSIAFILTFNQKKYVFLGDSYSNVIIESLDNLNITEEDPLEIEFLKISHHGSTYNTSKELLKRFDTNKYIISTDGTKDNLPNKRTLSRIINHNPNANIYFNYDHLIYGLVSCEDRELYPAINWEFITDYPL